MKHLYHAEARMGGLSLAARASQAQIVNGEENGLSSRFVIEERLLEPKSKPRGPSVQYAYTFLVYDPDYSIIRSADVFQSRRGLLPDMVVHAGSERGSPLYQVESTSRARLRGIVPDLVLRPLGEKPPLGWLSRGVGSWQVYRSDESLGAELSSPGPPWRRYLKSLVGTPRSFTVVQGALRIGALSPIRVPSPEGTGALVRRWVLTIERILRDDPALFELVLAASIQVVLKDRSVPVRTQLPLDSPAVERRNATEGYRPPPIR